MSNAVSEYLVVRHGEEFYNVDTTFLTSTWSCYFGNGCPGLDNPKDKNLTPNEAIGCCVLGAWFMDEEDSKEGDRPWDFDLVTASVKQLTEEDWDADLKAEAEKNGWFNKYKKEGIKTRVFNGGCIFANRDPERPEKKGCAFHHLAERTGQDVMDLKPEVCWMVPLNIQYDEEDDRYVHVHRFDNEQWGGGEKVWDWWCIDDEPDAYVQTDKMVYQTMEKELRRLIGDGPYEAVVEAIETHVLPNKRRVKMLPMTT